MDTSTCAVIKTNFKLESADNHDASGPRAKDFSDITTGICRPTPDLLTCERGKWIVCRASTVCASGGVALQTDDSGPSHFSS